MNISCWTGAEKLAFCVHDGGTLISIEKVETIFCQRNLGCLLLSVLYDIYTSSNLSIKIHLKLKPLIHPLKSV